MHLVSTACYAVPPVRRTPAGHAVSTAGRYERFLADTWRRLLLAD
jgi:hypothetical protein